MYACLAVTCHLHFWQNDRDLLRATVVTRGWNGYRNKSQHRKSTLEKKILPPFQQGFEPATFQSRVRRSDHWAIPAPKGWRQLSCCFTSTEAGWPIRDGDRVGRGQGDWLDRGNRPKKTGETVDRRQNNGSVKAVSPRHCPATCALCNCSFNCCAGQSH